MFGLGVSEILIILVVAVLLFGPQQLPEVGRQVGKAIRGLKEATENVKRSVEPELDLIRAEMRAVEQDVESSMQQAGASMKNEIKLDDTVEAKKA
jgi:TatA/E family protein of Tat protein translocase